MNKGLKYSEIGKDLLQLYCKVRVGAIEDDYIKVSQSHQYSLDRWLSKNKNIRDELINPDVYGALEALVFLKKKIGEKPALNEIVKALTPQASHLSKTPIIISFGGLVSQYPEILLPFGNIIGVISDRFKLPEGQNIENPEEISKDLEFIDRAFSGAKASTKDDKHSVDRVRMPKATLSQKRTHIFTYLFRRFSEDLAAATESAGLSEISQKFRDGILGVPPPMGLGQYVELDPISNTQMGESKRMADYVFKYPDLRNAAYLHDLIEIQLLQKSGVIAPEDAYKFKEVHEQQKNVLDYLENEEAYDIDKQKGIDTGDTITTDSRLNPDYIYMLIMFFIFLQQKLRIPSSGMVRT